MPFTISHAAAALPLYRLGGGRLRFAAIAIGCASPDFEFFLHLNAVGRSAHSIAGVILFCLPASWFVLWLWDLHGRRGVQELLPRGWFLPPPSTDASIIRNTVAILLGAASHLIWDGFTHDTDWAVRLLPALKTSLTIASLSVPWFSALQHASTLSGLAILSYAAWRWARTQPPVPVTELAGRLLIPTVVTGVAGLLNGLRFWELGLRSFLVAGAVGGMLAMGAGVVLYGAARRSIR